MNIRDIHFYLIIILIIGVAALNLFIFLPFLKIIAVALVASVVCQPIYTRVLKYLGGREGISAFLTTLIIVIIFLVPLAFISVQVFQESVGLYNSLTENRSETVSLSTTLLDYVYKIFPSLENYAINIDEYLSYGLEYIARQSGAVFTSIGQSLFSLLLFFISLYYFLKDKERFHRFLSAFSPLSNSVDQKIIQTMTVTINSVVGGTLIIAVLQGVLVGVGLAIFGVPNFVLWGIVAAFAALVPGLGTALVIVPAVLFLLITSNMANAIGLLVWGLLLVGLIDNFLGPKIVSRKTNIHPLVIFFSVLGGLAFFGPSGFILGPLSVSLLYIFIEVYLGKEEAVS